LRPVGCKLRSVRHSITALALDLERIQESLEKCLPTQCGLMALYVFDLVFRVFRIFGKYDVKFLDV
jgi:hypothetical protein